MRAVYSQAIASHPFTHTCTQPRGCAQIKNILYQNCRTVATTPHVPCRQSLEDEVVEAFRRFHVVISRCIAEGSGFRVQDLGLGQTDSSGPACTRCCERRAPQGMGMGVRGIARDTHTFGCQQMQSMVCTAKAKLALLVLPEAPYTTICPDGKRVALATRHTLYAYRHRCRPIPRLSLSIERIF